MARILLVDDDKNNLSAMRRVLMAEPGYTIEATTSAAEALARSELEAFDLVVVDYRMPEMDGVRFLEAFQLLQPRAYRIIASAFSDAELLRGAINRAHIHRFIQKPWDGFLLADAVAQGLAQVALGHDLERTRAALEQATALLQSVAASHPQALPADWQSRITLF